jgi:hypothetical protein
MPLTIRSGIFGKSQGDAMLPEESALRLERRILEGSCLGSLGADLVPLNIVV